MTRQRRCKTFFLSRRVSNYSLKSSWIRKNNSCFSTYTRNDLKYTLAQYFQKKNILIDILKRELTPAIFCFVWITHAQLLRDSEPIRLFETAKSPSEYILIAVSISIIRIKPRQFAIWWKAAALTSAPTLLSSIALFYGSSYRVDI